MRTNFTNDKPITNDDSKSLSFMPLSKSLDFKVHTDKYLLNEYNIASAFYQKGLQCYYKRDFLIATFMMQQAARFTYTVLIKIVTGVESKELIIKKLRDNFLKYQPDFKDVFPCDNEAECNLLKKLESAHLDIKYVPDFEITEEEVLQLLERVEELIELAKEVFIEKSKYLILK